MVVFEDLVDNLRAQGYDIIKIEVNDDPDVRVIYMKDANGQLYVKKYTIELNDVLDANGNVIGIEEDWVEIT